MTEMRTNHLWIPALMMSCATPLLAGNPLLPRVFAADPSAHVWPVEKKCDLPASDAFTEVTLGNFKLRAGDNDLQFSRFPHREATGIQHDALVFEPATP